MTDDDAPAVSDLELTDRQREVLHHLRDNPSLADLANRLRIGETTTYDHLTAIRKKGIGIEYDQASDAYYLDDPRAPKLRRISTKHMGTKTREANELIQAEESVLLRRLRRTDPLRTPQSLTRGAETLVGILSDLHFGDIVEDYNGNIIYDTETAYECVEAFGEQLLRIRDLHESRTDFDGIDLWILGDIATGEGIYEGQVYDIESYLGDQVTDSVESLFRLLVTLADEFPTVRVRCIVGNHGIIRASGVSRQANTDLIVYRWLDDRLRTYGASNIDFRVAEATHHMNTTVRDWKVHLRHGQDGHPHVDKTAASKSKWRGWLHKHRFDIAARGHYHNPTRDHVMGRYPVFTCSSPKPGGEYIERLGSPDPYAGTHYLGWAFGTSDTRPVTFDYLLDDASDSGGDDE